MSVYEFQGNQIVSKSGQMDLAAFHAEACANVRPEECSAALKAIGQA